MIEGPIILDCILLMTGALAKAALVILGLEGFEIPKLMLFVGKPEVGGALWFQEGKSALDDALRFLSPTAIKSLPMHGMYVCVCVCCAVLCCAVVLRKPPQKSAADVLHSKAALSQRLGPFSKGSKAVMRVKALRGPRAKNQDYSGLRTESAQI